MTQPGGLSRSERIILQQTAEGKSNKAIADALCVGENTVKFHCKNIFQKLEVTPRTAAVNVRLTSSDADS